MPWFRVDDSFGDHPKVLDLDLATIGLWTLAGTYASRYLTDGLITDSALRRIAPHVSIGTKRKLAARLVAAGLWELVDDGTQIHDFGDYNPDAATEKEKRRKRAEAGRKGGERSGATRRSKAEANREANASPDAEPNASRSVRTPSRPVPSRPVPEATAADLSTGRPPLGDDRERDPRVIAAIEALADEDLANAVGAGRVRHTDSYRRRCIESRWDDDGPGLTDLAATMPDATTDALIRAHAARTWLT